MDIHDVEQQGTAVRGHGTKRGPGNKGNAAPNEGYGHQTMPGIKESTVPTEDTLPTRSVRFASVKPFAKAFSALTAQPKWTRRPQSHFSSRRPLRIYQPGICPGENMLV
jgi:hypothetical protein